jgi:hypothetical protein
VSTLLIETLDSVDPLTQQFRLSLDTRYVIGAFIPYLYMHNAPNGIFTFEILKSGITVFQKSFTSADIKASLNTTDDYAHVFYPVVPATPMILEKGEFTAKLQASGGYDHMANGFLAWIKQHEDLNNELDYTPSIDLQNPLALRLKILKQGIYV